MAYIGQNPIDAFRGLASYDTFTGDGSTTSFDLSKSAPNGGQNDIIVVVNNVIQEPGTTKSFTLGTDGNGDYKRVTFNTAPVSADEIYVINPGRTTAVNTVSDNAITTSKLNSNLLVPVTSGGTGVTTSTGSGNTVLSTSPTLTTPALGTPSALVLTNATGLPVAGGGTGISTTTAYGVLAGGTTATGAFQNIGTGTSTYVLTSNGSGALPTFQAASGGEAWQAVKTSGFTAVAKQGYFCNTTSTAFTATLPASATIGDFITFIDYAGTYATNNLTIGRNSHKIQGDSSDLVVSTARAGFTLVYVDATQGWLITQK